MACENCENGCADPNLCACDCQSCAESNGCDIPVGDIGPQGPSGPMGPAGADGAPGTNGEDGVNGCSILNVYLAEGGETVDSGFAVEGDIVIETGPAPSPCNQTYVAGNITNIFEEGGGNSGDLPVGIICMYSGNVSDVNSLPNWVICDGANGTPDLRGRFVVMPDQVAGAAPAMDANNNPLWPNIGDTGGVPFVCLFPNNIPAHVHSLENVDISLSEGGAHYHHWAADFTANVPASIFGGGSQDYAAASNWNCNECGGVSNPTFRITLDPSSGGECTGDNDPRCGAHIHDVTMDGDTGDGQPELGSPDYGDCFNTIPPYYALLYIMKIS